MYFEVSLRYISVLAFIIPVSYASAAPSTPFLPQNFTRWCLQSSVVVDNWLYIDGGEVWNKTGGAYGYPLAASIAIDLKTDWTNATVAPTISTRCVDKVPSRRPWLWYDGHTINNYGGWFYENPPLLWDFKSTVSSQSVSATNLYQTSLADRGSMECSKASDQLHVQDAGSQLSLWPTWGSSMSSTSEDFFSFGGQYTNSSGAQGSNLGGFVYQTFQNSTWQNNSEVSFPLDSSKYRLFGETYYTSLFGEKGIIIIIGGYNMNNVNDTTGTQMPAPADMAPITIFDIASQRLLSQNATGDIPRGRWHFCASGADDLHTNTTDIFIYGGISGLEADPTYVPDLTFFYVLSLPSFTWSIVYRGSDQMRHSHTCSTIGQRQMVVIGGYNPAAFIGGDYDPWTNGIGVFDMVTSSWSDNYNSSAMPYQRSSTLNDAIGAAPAIQWESDDVRNLFVKHSNNTTRAAHPPNVGAIVGGVLGGLALLTVVAIVFAIRYRYSSKKSREEREKNAINRISDQSRLAATSAELPGHIENNNSDKLPVVAELTTSSRDLDPSELPNSFQLQNSRGRPTSSTLSRAGLAHKAELHGTSAKKVELPADSAVSDAEPVRQGVASETKHEQHFTK